MTKIYKRKECFELWEQFGNIGIDNNDNIDEPFLFFPKGTDRFDIIRWFEETYNGFIAGENMT